MAAPGAAAAPTLSRRTRSQLPLPPDSKVTLTRPNDPSAVLSGVALAFTVPVFGPPVFAITAVGLPRTTVVPAARSISTRVDPLLPTDTTLPAVPGTVERSDVVLMPEKPGLALNVLLMFSVLVCGDGPTNLIRPKLSLPKAVPLLTVPVTSAVPLTLSVPPLLTVPIQCEPLLSVAMPTLSRLPVHLLLLTSTPKFCVLALKAPLLTTNPALIRSSLNVPSLTIRP